MSDSDEQSADEGTRKDAQDDPQSDPHDEDREAILKRRRRLVAAALSSLTLGAAVSNCAPTACLSPRPEDVVSNDAVVAEAQACLSVRPDDSGADATADASDGGPMPCLDIAPTDAGGD